MEDKIEYRVFSTEDEEYFEKVISKLQVPLKSISPKELEQIKSASQVLPKESVEMAKLCVADWKARQRSRISSEDDENNGHFVFGPTRNSFKWPNPANKNLIIKKEDSKPLKHEDYLPFSCNSELYDVLCSFSAGDAGDENILDAMQLGENLLEVLAKTYQAYSAAYPENLFHPPNWQSIIRWARLLLPPCKQLMVDAAESQLQRLFPTC